MAYRPKVFASFDYENDRHYKYLLEAWSANPKFEFVFEDLTPGEIDSSNIGRIKAALTLKINEATHTLVLVGRYANSPHPKQTLIGKKNWINWEIWQSNLAHNRFAAVMLEPGFSVPEELSGLRVSWSTGFNEPGIIRALEIS